MSTASTSLQNTTSSCLNWSSFVLGLLTDSNYNIDAIVWYFQISTKHNKCYLKILFIFFSFCQTELSNYISLTSPLAAPFSLQFARCCIFGRSMLQAQQWKQNCSVISPSLASGISHSTRKLQRHNKLLQSTSRIHKQRETVAATHLSLKRLQNMMHIIYQFVFIYYIYTWLPVQLGLKSLGMYFMCSSSGRLNSGGAIMYWHIICKILQQRFAYYCKSQGGCILTFWQ